MNWANILLVIQQMSPIEAVLVTIVAIYFLYKGGYIIIKRKRKDVIEDPRDLLAIHKPCVNYPSMLVILERAMKQSDDIMHIKYIETVYDQMNAAEESWRRIRIDLRQGFVNNLNSKLPELKKQEAKICYNLVLDKIGKDLLGLMRKWIKRNHFTEKTEIEFQTYIQERIQDLEEFFSIAIQDVYVPSDMQVDLEELRKFNIEKIMPQIGKELVSFFMKARNISQEKEAKIKQIKEQLPQ